MLLHQFSFGMLDCEVGKTVVHKGRMKVGEAMYGIIGVLSLSMLKYCPCKPVVGEWLASVLKSQFRFENINDTVHFQIHCLLLYIWKWHRPRIMFALSPQVLTQTCISTYGLRYIKDIHSFMKVDMIALYLWPLFMLCRGNQPLPGRKRGNLDAARFQIHVI